MPNDPLSDLRDIHLPDPGGFWPPAPGWWFLAILILVAAALAGSWFLRRYRRNRWLASARRELDQLTRSPAPESQRLLELNRLLKRAARARYPQRRPETLSGEAWVAFLRDTAPSNQPEAEALFRRLAESSWRPHTSLTFDDAQTIVKGWLRGQKC
ncbi:MAG: DUF4381 domain-containing protein [Oleiphilaceae bacterium]|nr:DUF4381 domain-containing protein [Oleiphilaceae bacterium]